MKLNLKKELATLERMTVGELQQRYLEVFGEPIRSRHKQYLIRRIAWRLQANAEGGLSERALRRAEELANVADVRVMPPRDRVARPRKSARGSNAAAHPADPRPAILSVRLSNPTAVVTGLPLWSGGITMDRVTNFKRKPTGTWSVQYWLGGRPTCLWRVRCWAPP